VSTAKKIVCEELGLAPSSVSVRKGRGTAHSWLYIKTAARVDLDLRERVSERLVRERLVGQYLTDHGIDDELRPNVLWQTRGPGLTTCDMK
jgi:hypothetical protein